MRRTMACRIWLSAGLVCLAALAGARPARSDAASETVRLRLAFAEPRLEAVAGPYTRVTCGDLPLTSEPGRPALPFRLVRLLLPPFGEVTSLSVTTLDERWVGQALTPAPVVPQEPTADQPFPPASSQSLPVEDHGGTLWPVAASGLPTEQRLEGYRLLTLRVYPLRYSSAKGALLYAPQIEVRVQVASGGRSPAPATVAPDLLSRLQALVDNPGAASLYAPLASSPRNGVTLDGPLSLAQPRDYVIITARALSAALAPLVAWRASQGLAVGMYAIEDIRAAYAGARPSGGNDDATRLRAFLQDAHAAWQATAHPLRYVLLAGDSELVPVRMLCARAGIYETSDANPLVSDLYYAGLDGTWDADADGRYGEGAQADGGTGAAGEEADLYAELCVGRAPISLEAGDVPDRQARNWVAKVLSYEADPSADYLSRGLWLGEMLDGNTLGDASMEEVAPLVPGLALQRLYDGAERWTAQQLVERINAGVHVLNHLGHASSASVLRLNATQVQGLANPAPFLVHTQGCLAAAIATGDGEAIGEHFLTAERGAFAFVGNTSYGWYAPGSTRGASQTYDLGFFRALFERNIARLGPALQDAREQAMAQVGAVGPERWVCLELILLGDPYTAIATRFRAPAVRVLAPNAGSRVSGQVPLRASVSAGSAVGATLAYYRASWSAGANPTVWTDLTPALSTPVVDAPLADWDTGLLADGVYSLRIVALTTDGLASDERLCVNVRHADIIWPATDAYLPAGGTIAILGTAERADLTRFTLEAGLGYGPSAVTQWLPIAASSSSVVSGTLGLWDTGDLTQAGEYTLRLTVEGDSYMAQDWATFTLDPQYEPGWPRAVGNNLANESLAVGDLDGDGDMEVVASEGMYQCGGALEGGRCGAYGMRVYAWGADGERLPGWPQMPGSDNWLSAPTLADLDADADLEILVGSIDGRVYAYHHDGQQVLGWPQSVAGQALSAPACADLDDDGAGEVACSDTLGYVYLWSGDGALLPGWPKLLETSAVPTGGVSALLLADLDGDELPEVLAAGSAGTVYCWEQDGSSVAGWPADLGEDIPATGLAGGAARIPAPPVAGDLDADGRLEVVVLTNNALWILRDSGEVFAGWPVSWDGRAVDQAALADVDGNGSLEIVASSTYGRGLRAWSIDGQVVPGWEAVLLSQWLSSPVVGDIDGDDAPEVLVAAGDSGRALYAFHGDGTPVQGWPRAIPNHDVPYPAWSRRCTPVLVDLDGDGLTEVGLGVERYVFFWQTPADLGPGGWPSYRSDMQRTGAVAPRLRQQQYLPLLRSP